MQQLSRAKRLSIAAALLTVVFAAAAGTYFIADNVRKGAIQPQQAVTEARKRCTVDVVAGPTFWDTCLCAFTDVRKIEQPIIIDKPTVWACVDYALTTVNIASTGSLTVVNSSLRFPTEDVNANVSMWQGLLNWGQLRIYSSRIGVSTVVEPSAEAVFEARDSNLTDTEALGGTTLLERVKPYYVTWGGFVRVSGAAQVTLMDSNFEVLRIEPMTSFIDIEGFNSTSLWSPTDYDFRVKWGLEQPFVRLVNVTAENFELDVMAGRSALISNSQFTMSEWVYGGFSSLILIHGGNVSLVNSKLEAVWSYNSVQVEEDGLVNVRHSELGPAYVNSGDCTISSSKLHGLKLQAYQDETIKIDGFDEDRDGGNYNFTSWGFTHLHANTLSSNVQGVTVVSSGAKVTISTSRLGGVSTSGGNIYVSDSQLQTLDLDYNGLAVAKVYRSRLGSIYIYANGGSAEVSNGTVISIDADEGAVVNLLNVTLSPSGYINTREGLIVVAWYVLVKVYDAETQIPLNGVSLTAKATTGNVTSLVIDGSNRIVLVGAMMMGGGYLAHEYGGYVYYFPYNLTATRQGYIPNHTQITELRNNTAIEIYMQPAITPSSPTTAKNEVSSRTSITTETIQTTSIAAGAILIAVLIGLFVVAKKMRRRTASSVFGK